MLYLNHLVITTMNYQQFTIKFHYLLAIVEMLLYDIAKTPHFTSRHFLQSIERRHQDQQGHFSIPSQVRSSPAPYRPTHHIDISNSSIRS